MQSSSTRHTTINAQSTLVDTKTEEAPMPNNTRALIDQVVEVAQQARDHRLPDSVAFELFAAQCVLKARNLSDEEVAAGLIGGGGDGGLDTLHVFLEGVPLTDDSDIFSDDFRASTMRRGAELELVMTQAKTETSYTETAIDKAESSLRRLLDLEKTDEELSVTYSQELIKQMRLFTRAWTLLGVRTPVIKIEFTYATRGHKNTAGEPVVSKLKDLENLFRVLAPGAKARCMLLGCDELWESASSAPSYDLQLRFREYSTQGASYVGLVTLSDYYDFLADENGDMRSHLFDWNVRDFQGENAVNRGIKASLLDDSETDFWWLNNGVTVLCSDVAIGGDRRFTLRDVQIVNGMQTSQSLFTVLSEEQEARESNRTRSILVRVIQTEDNSVRDQIIRATNSQTRVPDASLHATEPIHRQIESFFSSDGWYYDRRKNFYRNAGKPTDRIISIGLLGQATMAIGLSRPNDARARPTTLLNSPDDYEKVFSADIPLSVYLWMAQLQRAVDSELGESVEAFVRTNLRFHVSAYLGTKLFGARIYSPKQLTALSSARPDVTPASINDAVTSVERIWNYESSEREWSYDKVSKSSVFAELIIDEAISGL
jgi:hypothetical protein